VTGSDTVDDSKTDHAGPDLDRRGRLLRAASQLFIERPYDQVTTTEIAGRAGVAYGLIAHHFGNKRGLYLAAIQAAADNLHAVQDTPPPGDTGYARLRAAISRHIDYANANADGFLAFIRGNLGADPEIRAIIDDLRWGGAQRILTALGAPHPPPPILRAGMHAWVGYLDELIIDDITHHDVAHDDLVDLATQALLDTLNLAAERDPAITVTLDLARIQRHVPVRPGRRPDPGAR
jgi:AcrR family transcriptional regulator